MNSTHLGWEKILDLVESDPDWRQQAHVATCQNCLDEGIKAAKLLGVLGERLPAVPRRIVEQALAAITQTGTLASFLGALRKNFNVLEALPVDGLKGSLVGVRGEASTGLQLFHTKSFLIAVSSSPQGKGRSQILGQVTARDTQPTAQNPAGHVLVEDGENERRVTLSETGEFVIADLPLGTYNIAVVIDEDAIVLNPIVV